MKRLLIIPLLLVIGLLFTTPALATLPPPTSISISDVAVYRNLAESGDMAIFFHTEMPFPSDNWSTTPASRAIQFRLYADDGTLMQTGHPYVNPYFQSNGYGDGCGSFYFAASDNQTDWESAAVIMIYGGTDFFDTAITQSHEITPTEYTSETTQAANREVLKEWILLQCDDLESAYQDTSIILKTTSDAGLVLSQYGEMYFRGAIPGLQNLCPDLFFIQSLIPEKYSVSYDMSLGETYAERLEGDDLGTGFTRLGTWAGIDGSFVAVIIVVLAGIAISIWTHKRGWGMEPGLLATFLIGVALAIIVGDAVFAIIMIGSLVAVIAIVWLLLLRRA